MGKNGKFGKDYGKVVGKDSKTRPGWKGPGYVKKVEPSSKPSTSREKDGPADNIIPLELQQLLLNIFRDSFLDTIQSDNLTVTLQEVKGALYERDFARAFGKREFLEAYSVRWSPCRALCYHSVLIDIKSHLTSFGSLSIRHKLDSENPIHLSPSLRAIAFGGGAAEIVAFGGFLRYMQQSLHLPTGYEVQETEGSASTSTRSHSPENLYFDLLLVDVADWEDIVRILHQSLISPPPMSKYASVSARQAKPSLLAAENISANFLARDALDMDPTQLIALFGNTPVLITLLFTLNELYTTSIGKTTSFLLNITATAASGSLLLVVDSPGSYSEATVGTQAKRYPMQWLLDHTLLETQKSRGQESTPDWTKMVSDDSKWFRPPDLGYALPLENMRYQMHLYRRN